MDTNKKEIKVWDPVVRIFHWALVLFVAIAFYTGDDLLKFHVQAGYAVLALIVFRVFWGFFGPKYARFSEFFYRPKVVYGYLKDLLSFKAKRYIGHGPAGGTMVIALIISLIFISITGLVLYGGEEAAGPFAGVLAGTSPFWIKAMEEAHEVLAGLIVLLVGFHVGGVLFASFAHGENLIKSMITGYKPIETIEHRPLEEELP